MSFDQHELWLRLAAFAAIFALMAVLERASPKRPVGSLEGRRWITNLSVMVLNGLMLRVMAGLALPLAAVAAAFYAATKEIGLFHWLAWPPLIEIVLAVVALDFALWLQHLASHKVQLLWRLHQVHHADVEIDVTTALRFHPVEIALSMIWKIACVLALGAAPAAVIAFEILLNGVAMFNHANIALPARLDSALRLLIVTPDMHRVHHSVLRREHNSNYGFNLSLWDRLFGTYTSEPEKGHAGMTIGLAAYQSEAPSHLGWTLILPFKTQQKEE